MSNYTGRRGPNVSQYIADLNSLPTQQDVAPAISVDDDFSLFTSTEFFDFDMGSISDVAPQVEYDPAQEERARRQNASAYRYGSIKPEPVNGTLLAPNDTIISYPLFKAMRSELFLFFIPIQFPPDYVVFIPTNAYRYIYRSVDCLKLFKSSRNFVKVECLRMRP
jgi:hypothetical protein